MEAVFRPLNPAVKQAVLTSTSPNKHIRVEITAKMTYLTLMKGPLRGMLVVTEIKATMMLMKVPTVTKVAIVKLQQNH